MGEQERQHAHESKFKLVFLTNRHMCMMELISSTCGFRINNSELNNMHCCLDGAAVKDLPTKHLILSCTCSGALRSTESCTSFLQDNVFCMHLLKPITLQPKHIGASQNINPIQPQCTIEASPKLVQLIHIDQCSSENLQRNVLNFKVCIAFRDSWRKAVKAS